MSKKILQKVKQNKAFTLIEMLIVVTMMIALVGISILGISDWSKTTKMTKLDNYAKSVYLEAQNQLAAMEAEGALLGLSYDLANETHGKYYAKYNTRQLTDPPADYSLTAFGDFYEGMYYFTNEDDISVLFVPEISIADEFGNYLIELNPSTGDVYGVFFWEASNEYLKQFNALSNASEIYTKLKTMEANGGANNRSLETRTKYEIGYYGGYGSDGGYGSGVISTPGYELNQKVNIVNGEELYIELSYDLNDLLIHQTMPVKDRFDIEITIEGLTSKKKWTPEFNLVTDSKAEENGYIENGDFVEKDGRLITYFLLDSMEVRKGENGMPIELSFAEITKGTGLIPGENLKISVKTIYQYRGVKLKEESTDYYTNSLFHDVTDSVNGEERVIGVSAVRHLRNLDDSKYFGDIATKIGEKEIKSYTIVQKNDIDCNKAEYLFSNKIPMNSLVEEEKLSEAERATYMDPFTPIDNSYIFWKDGMGNVQVKVDGNGYVIRNLNITSTENDGAGLFKRAKNVEFIDVRLEDCQVNAPENSTYTGGLVGLANGGKIQNSGIYLSPTYRGEFGIKQYYNQVQDSNYGNAMLKRYAIMTVTGGDVVGGLAGKVDGTVITDSYAAVQVKGKDTVGGLIGFAKGKIGERASDITTEDLVRNYISIKNCYASGDVYATGNQSDSVVYSYHQDNNGDKHGDQRVNITVCIEGAGGLIGHAEYVCMDNAYATGDVHCNNQMAGFIATSYNGYYQNCYSYGEVLTLSGNDEYGSSTIVGGFYASGEKNHAVDATLGYLSQIGYNNNVKTDTILKKSYIDMSALAAEGTTASSHPYDASLLFKVMPFKTVTEHHYGDWPTQYFINTSLVYYEKYKENNGRYSYGYYGVAKLADGLDDSNNDEYVWVLDSLRNDKACVEDGYALLSMFYLDSIDYTVYQAVGNNANPTWDVAKAKNKDGVKTPIKGTLKTVETESEAGSNKMVNLIQQGPLVFNAYVEDSVSPYNVNYKGKEIKGNFVANGMYLYQLPYELQNTYRYDVRNFYDVIKFEKGYAKGNTPADNGGIEPTPVIENEDYYYCPHFPKLAINPGLAEDNAQVGTGSYNFKLLKQPTEVAVRTARHLNNLGRVPYYWNNRGGAADVIKYNQELDINFSTYTKDYCGKVYNLLAFDQEYSNQPIGQKADLDNGYGAFQNDYNGNYHKIIDYSVKSSNQYVGLFGEIYKANGATGRQVENVVMTVSNENRDKQGNYQTADEKNQNNAGLIICTYQDSPEDNLDDPRVGVGAMIGSDYTVGAAFASGDDGWLKGVSNQVYTVYNCATEGYQVQYHVAQLPNQSYKQPKGIAIGGLLGYSRGNVAQSLANNDITLVLGATLDKKTSAVLIGGFSGSSHHGTTLNCYSGGTIDVDVKADRNGNKYAIDALYIGGFSPGWLYAEGVSSSGAAAKVTYINIYSYTELTDKVTQVKKTGSNGTFNTFVPGVSRMELNETNSGWTASKNNGYRGASVPGYAYYVATSRMQEIINNNDRNFKEFFEYSDWFLGINASPKTGDITNAQKMSDFSWVNSNKDYYGNTILGIPVKTEVKFIPTEGIYPELKKVATGDYPFPAYVKDANNNMIHYGEFPQ